jgi:SAM-dependent methyltransferase
MTDVEILTEVAYGDFPVDWYEIATPLHFWFQWRFNVLQQQIESSGISRSVDYKVLEIGCGHGVLRKQLENSTNWIIDGCDLNKEGLLQNDVERGRTFLYDIYTRAQFLEKTYDFLVLYDVLEHIEDTEGFLRAALFHLKKGGGLFVNVPALNGMFSDYDRAIGHLRRYDRSMLEKELEPHGLHIADIRYWGFTMLPLLGMRYARRYDNCKAADIIKKGITPPNAFINNLLKKLMYIETALIKKPPLGTSLMTFCRYR